MLHAVPDRARPLLVYPGLCEPPEGRKSKVVFATAMPVALHA